MSNYVYEDNPIYPNFGGGRFNLNVGVSDSNMSYGFDCIVQEQMIRYGSITPDTITINNKIFTFKWNSIYSFRYQIDYGYSFYVRNYNSNQFLINYKIYVKNTNTNTSCFLTVFEYDQNDAFIHYVNKTEGDVLDFVNNANKIIPLDIYFLPT